MGIRELNISTISVDELMNCVDLAEKSECCDKAILDVFFSDLRIGFFLSVVGVALDVKIDCFLRVFNFSLESGTSANFANKILVRLELLVLELGLVGNNVVDLFLLVADLFGLGAQEQVVGVN